MTPRYNLTPLMPTITMAYNMRYARQQQYNYLDDARVALNTVVELAIPVSWYTDSRNERVFIPEKTRAILKFSDDLQMFYLYFYDSRFEDSRYPYAICCITQRQGDTLPGFLMKVPATTQRIPW